MPFTSRIVTADANGGGTIGAGPRLYCGSFRFDDNSVSGYTLTNHGVSLALGLLERQHHVPVTGDVILSGGAADKDYVLLFEV